MCVRPVHLVRLAIACLAIGYPTLATATQVRHAAPAGAIRVSADSGKTKVSVHIPGMLDRVIWLKDQIYSVALADLNNDGHLDLVASTRRHVLVVWRSTPRGFVRQHVPRAPKHHVKYGPGVAQASRVIIAAQATDDNRDPVDLMPGMGLISALLPSKHHFTSGQHALAAPPLRHFGRAPPQSA